MSVFKAYDVRGEYPKELNEELAYRIGSAYARFLREKKVIVGRDARLSSPALARGIISGLRDYGVTVIDIGICSTPLLYFASREADAVMVTASHNQKNDNGFKFVRKGGIPIGYKTGLEKIEQLCLKPSAKVKKSGTLKKKSFAAEYLKFLEQFFEGIDPSLRVVVDASGGSAGPLLEQLLSRLGMKRVRKLYTKPDGHFRGHSPDPLSQGATRAAASAVKSFKAKAGAVFDGDGDRVIFLDETGKVVRSDLMLALVVRAMVKNAGQKNVILDLRTGHAVFEEMRRLNALAVHSRVGRTNVYQAMKDEHALVGGELSGHFFFKDFWYMDNADMAFLIVLSILSRSDYSLSELIRPLDRYANSGELNFKVTHGERAITHVYNIIRAKFKDAKINFLDGLSISCKDWWFTLRASNTEPVVRLVVEARSKKLLDKRVRLLTKLIKE